MESHYHKNCSISPFCKLFKLFEIYQVFPCWRGKVTNNFLSTKILSSEVKITSFRAFTKMRMYSSRCFFNRSNHDVMFVFSVLRLRSLQFSSCLHGIIWKTDRQNYCIIALILECLGCTKFIISSSFIVRTETVVQRCSIRKAFLEISQNSQENSCVRASF